MYVVIRNVGSWLDLSQVLSVPKYKANEEGVLFGHGSYISPN